MEPAKLSLPILEGVLGKYSIYLNLEYKLDKFWHVWKRKVLLIVFIYALIGLFIYLNILVDFNQHLRCICYIIIFYYFQELRFLLTWDKMIINKICLCGSKNPHWMSLKGYLMNRLTPFWAIFLVWWATFPWSVKQ